MTKGIKILLTIAIIFFSLILVYEVKIITTISKPRITIQKVIKPSYEELKSHTVYIIGCSGDIDLSEKLTYPINDEGTCWSGTGGIIKITNKETFILSNAHVAGKGQNDVILYIKHDNRLIRAEIVKYSSHFDMVVIKIQEKLKDKTPIKKISKVNIQDSVYVVGHPLGVQNVYAEGIVVGNNGVSMLLQLPCIYGNSGSFVIDKNGNLVGLVFALEMYPGFLGIPEARITHTLAINGFDIKIFLQNLNLYNEN